MDQRGYIVEVMDDKTAKFQMRRMSACASCGKCIGAAKSESMDIIVEVDNSIGSQVGDYVEVSMEHINAMRALGILYGLPLIALVAGTVGSYYALGSVVAGHVLEVYSFGIGLLVTGIVYGLIRLRDESFKKSKKYMPTVTRILEDLKPIPGF